MDEKIIEEKIKEFFEDKFFVEDKNDNATTTIGLRSYGWSKISTFRATRKDLSDWLRTAFTSLLLSQREEDIKAIEGLKKSVTVVIHRSEGDEKSDNYIFNEAIDQCVLILSKKE